MHGNRQKQKGKNRHRKNHCEGKTGSRERKAQRLSSQEPGRKRTKESGMKGKDRKRKQKVSTSGTAAGAKLGRTKGNKQEAKYIDPDGVNGKPVRTEGESQGSESGNGSTERAAVRR